MAGTGAFFTGSIFIAIVPPVAISRTTGRTGAGRSAAAGGFGAGGCWAWAAAQANQKGTASRQATRWRMGVLRRVSSRAVTLVGHAVQAAQRLQAPGRPAPGDRGAHRRDR